NRYSLQIYYIDLTTPLPPRSALFPYTTLFRSLFRHFLDVGRHRPESLPNGKRQSRLDAFPERLSLLLLETLGNAFVISRQGVISLVRDSFLRKPRVHQSNEGIPAHDVRVEKRQWFPGFYRLNPKRRPAEFNAEGVEINPVDAVTNHFT